MAIVNDRAMAMTVAMAIDNALAYATAVVIVPPYHCGFPQLLGLVRLW